MGKRFQPLRIMGKLSNVGMVLGLSTCPRLILPISPVANIHNTTHHYKMVALYIQCSLIFNEDIQKGSQGHFKSNVRKILVYGINRNEYWCYSVAIDSFVEV